MKKALLLLITIALITSCNSEDDSPACMTIATYTVVDSANKSANKTTCDLTNEQVFRDIPDSNFEPNNVYLVDLGFYYEEGAINSYGYVREYGNRWKFVCTFPEDAGILLDFSFYQFGSEIGIATGNALQGQIGGNAELEFTTIMSEAPYGKPRGQLVLQNAYGLEPIYDGFSEGILRTTEINTGNIIVTDISTCEQTVLNQNGDVVTPQPQSVDCTLCNTTTEIDGVTYLIECN